MTGFAGPPRDMHLCSQGSSFLAHLVLHSVPPPATLLLTSGAVDRRQVAVHPPQTEPRVVVHEILAESGTDVVFVGGEGGKKAEGGKKEEKGEEVGVFREAEEGEGDGGAGEDNVGDVVAQIAAV